MNKDFFNPIPKSCPTCGSEKSMMLEEECLCGECGRALKD
jgi:hypothetical protein